MDEDNQRHLHITRYKYLLLSTTQDPFEIWLSSILWSSFGVVDQYEACTHYIRDIIKLNISDH